MFSSEKQISNDGFGRLEQKNQHAVTLGESGIQKALNIHPFSGERGQNYPEKKDVQECHHHYGEEKAGIFQVRLSRMKFSEKIEQMEKICKSHKKIEIDLKGI